MLRKFHDRFGFIVTLHAGYARVEKALLMHGILPARLFALPDFLGIGATKAGTTWLYHNLAAHPEIYFPYKELHYFDRRYNTSLLVYARHFAGQGRGRLKGDITPGYSILSREQIAFVHHIMPGARLIFLMRDPVTRSWSEAMHNLLRKGVKFDYDDLTPDVIQYMLDTDAVRLRSDYVTILDNWLSAYPAEQLYFTVYERIETEPQAVLADVFAFLGVRPDIDMTALPLNERFNVNPPTEIPEMFQLTLRERYAPMVDTLAARYGVAVDAWHTG